MKAGCIFVLDRESLKTEYRRNELNNYSLGRFVPGDWTYVYE